VLLHDGEPWPGAAKNAEWRQWLRSVGASQVDSGQGQFSSLANMSIESALNHQGVAMGRATLVEDFLRQGHLGGAIQASSEKSGRVPVGLFEGAARAPTCRS